MHKAIVLAVSAFLLCAVTASAQTPPAPPPAPAPEGEAPSEARIAAAMELLKANHTVDNLNAVFDAIEPQETAQIKRRSPNMSDEAIAKVIHAIRGIIFSRQDELLRLYGIEYARHFSEQELRDLAAFYRSDLGKKYIAEVPVLIKETSPLAVRWVVGVITQEQQKILDAMPKEDKKT